MLSTTPDYDYYTSTTIPPPPSLSHSSSQSLTSSSTSTADENLSNGGIDWWSNAIEEDSFYSPLPFDASESGFFNGRFVPPPPRPPFWDDTITSDGLTTCDLCTWALHERNAFSLDGSISGMYLSYFLIFLF